MVRAGIGSESICAKRQGPAVGTGTLLIAADCVIMARRTKKPAVLKSRRGVIILLIVIAVIFATLYLGVGATGFFRTQPPPM